MKTNIVNSFNNTSYHEVIERVTKTTSNLLQLDKNNTVTVVLTNDQQVQSLNNQFRNKDATTDVLTFPDGTMHHLGDIIISMEQCERQRLDYQHSFERELGFLVVHGILHTLGYDHQTSEEETIMNALQDKILHKAKLYR